MSMKFTRASRKQARLRMALIGPAGAGKTMTALKIATHLGAGPVALFDTERGSASKYAGETLPDGTRLEFDVLEPDDFSPETYVRAIKAAEDAGYGVLVIDSLSHAWMGRGGALEMVDKASKRAQGGGNNFGAWREVTPKHNEMVDAIVSARLHVIATMRSKMEYVQEKDEKTGKTTIRKIGLQPVQRDGLEYEFDLVGDLDQDNNLIVGKTRCPALAGQVFSRAGADVAETLKAWLTDGDAEAEETDEAKLERARKRAGEMFRELNALGHKPGWSKVTIDTYINGELMWDGGFETLPLEKFPELLKKLNMMFDPLLAAGKGASS
jgi:hypothetical protein